MGHLFLSVWLAKSLTAMIPRKWTQDTVNIIYSTNIKYLLDNHWGQSTLYLEKISLSLARYSSMNECKWIPISTHLSGHNIDWQVWWALVGGLSEKSANNIILNAATFFKITLELIAHRNGIKILQGLWKDLDTSPVYKNISMRQYLWSVFMSVPLTHWLFPKEHN